MKDEVREVGVVKTPHNSILPIICRRDENNVTISDTVNHIVRDTSDQHQVLSVYCGTTDRTCVYGVVQTV